MLKPSRNATKRYFFLDTETYRITRESPVPKFVCMQCAYDNEEPRILGGNDVGKEAARIVWDLATSNPDVTLVAHNGFYDYSRLINLDDYWMPGARDKSSAIMNIMAMCLNGRIRDTQVMGKLNAIEYDWMGFDRVMWAKPKFSLAYLAKRFAGITMTGKEGDDAWRMNYHKLDGIPVGDWPEEARQYALDDITHLRSVFYALDKNEYADEKFQTAAYWVFRLMEIWGLRTSEERVEALKSKVIPFIEKANERLIEAGLMRPGTPMRDTDRFENFVRALCKSRNIEPQITPTGRIVTSQKYLSSFNVPILLDKQAWQTPAAPVRNMRDIKIRLVNWYNDHGLPVPMVDKKPKDDDYDFFSGNPDDDIEEVEVADPTEGVSTDREALSSTDDPDLQLLGEIGKLKTLATTFIPRLEQGYVHPIRPAWNGLVVTGRPSCYAGEFGTNLLNQPREVRKGEPGVRECYRAREGYVYVDGDAVQAELCGLAQICIDKFGYSQMGEIIRDGKDIHSWFGAFLCDRTYEEVVDGVKKYKAVKGGDPDYKWAADARQMAKPCNFGFPGGLGAKKFVKWARKQYEVLFTESQVKRYKAMWLQQFPEIQDYFDWVNDQIRSSPDGKHFTYTQHRSNRRRGGCKFCDGANTGFQGIIADGVKNAMIKVFIACHSPGEPLFGSRLCAQIYDEMLLEVPIATSGAAAAQFKKIFEQGINEYLPDVPATVEVEMMWNWSKLAKPVYNAAGELIPFDNA